MFFYRFILHRIIHYFGLDKISKSKHDHSHAPKIYKTEFKANKRKNMMISVIMSILSILLWISIPFAVLESPTDIFKEMEWNTIYSIVLWLEKYINILNYIIIALGIALIVVALDTVLDGIKHTDITLSPWVEKGKYVAPIRSRRKRSRSSSMTS